MSDQVYDPFNTETPEDVAEKNRKAREEGGSYLPYFNPKEDETSIVRFIDDEPLTFYQHRVWDPLAKDGAGGWRVLTCKRKNCELCAAGDKPRYVGAYRLVHIDNLENGKQVPKLKIFLKGVNTLEVLVRRNKKRPLSSQNLEVERIGKGFDTKYTFEGTGDETMPNYEKPDNCELRTVFAIQEDVVKRLAGSVSKKEKDKSGSTGASSAKQSAAPSSSQADDDDDIPF